MAKILCIETATTNCSVSVVENGKLLALQEENTINYKHSEQLHLFIKTAVAKAGVTLQDLNAVAVSKGPGSYTGLRIGVSAAKGLCFALDIPLISILTLHSLALQVSPQKTEVVIPLLDARRMEAYAAVFDHNFTLTQPTWAEIITPTSFKNFATAKTLHLIGSGAQKCEAVLPYGNIKYYPNAVPSAKEMAALAQQKFEQNSFEDVAYFEPFYLKDFVLGGKPKA